jgi:general L-amino acid transport system permease protein
MITNLTNWAKKTLMTGRRNSTDINTAPTPLSKQPPSKVGAIHWLRKNIFNGVTNSLLSLIVIAFVVAVLSNIIEWAILNAVWNAESIDECHEIIIATHGAEAHGACWAVLKGRVDLLLFGFYPPEHYWRPITALFLLLAALAPILLRSLPRMMLCFTAIYPVIAYYLIWGGFGFEVTNSRNFGGLLLTLIIAIAGIAIAILIGTALALGRQFLILPLRIICATIIAFARGVPLIILMFAAFFLTKLSMPPGTYIDPIFRAIAVIALHTGCRIAGAIREELVALPQGQWEATSALGFSHRKAIWLIILPQVLRRMLPWIVLASIGVFRDTTLVSLMGLLDPVALLNAIRTDENWHGVIWELFVFVGLLYWFFCFCMTCYSKFLERRLNAEGRHHST